MSTVSADTRDRGPGARLSRPCRPLLKPAESTGACSKAHCRMLEIGVLTCIFADGGILSVARAVVR
jgi:hypothetical protein